MEEGSAERAAFIEAFKIDMGRSLNIPPTSIVVTGIFVVDDNGRRRLEGEEEVDHSPQVPLADLHDTARRSLQRGRRPVVVVVERATLVVEFKIMEVVNALAARAIVDDLALQGSDPTSALRTANVTGKVTRVDTVRMDEPSSWVADLNDAIVAASCEGQQILVTVTYGNTAWSLTRFPDTEPLLSGETDLVEEYYCVPDGIYSMSLWPSSTLVSRNILRTLVSRTNFCPCRDPAAAATGPSSSRTPNRFWPTEARLHSAAPLCSSSGTSRSRRPARSPHAMTPSALAASRAWICGSTRTWLTKSRARLAQP